MLSTFLRVASYLLGDLLYALRKGANNKLLDITRGYQCQKTFKIPRIIHQTNKSYQVAPDVYMATQQLIGMNEEFLYNFYDNEGCRGALEEHFGVASPQLRAFDRVRPGAYKADIFRLCILYAEGGIYIDSKETTVLPISAFMSPTADVVAVADVRETRLQTGAFLASTPRNAIIEAMMNEAVRRVLAGEYGHNCLDIAGPECCGRAVQKLMGMDSSAKFHAGCQYTAVGMDGSAPVTMEITGTASLLNACVFDVVGRPIIKLQPVYQRFLSWAGLRNRYEFAWMFRTVFITY